jgi:hypothetical protein
MHHCTDPFKVAIISIILGSTTIQTTTTSDFAMNQKIHSITTLSVSLGRGIPALLITISGLFLSLSKRSTPNNGTFQSY